MKRGFFFKIHLNPFPIWQREKKKSEEPWKCQKTPPTMNERHIALHGDLIVVYICIINSCGGSLVCFESISYICADSSPVRRRFYNKWRNFIRNREIIFGMFVFQTIMEWRNSSKKFISASGLPSQRNDLSYSKSPDFSAISYFFAFLRISRR